MDFTPNSQKLQDAESLLNYTGDAHNYTGNALRGFDGRFYDAKRTLILKVVHNSVAAADGTLVLCPGLGSSSADGVIASGNFDDEEGNASQFTGSVLGSGSISSFLTYIENNPMQLLSMKIKSTDADQTEVEMTSQIQDPFSTNAVKKLNFSKYVDSDDFNDKIVYIKNPADLVDFQFNRQNKISIPIVDGSTATITLNFGLIYNTAGALDQVTRGSLGR